jgi:hypothetical protein
MRILLIVLALASYTAFAHPGIALVKDSKGNLYYSDLQQVWKISGGQRTLAVPNVHTHELYIDAQDNLYGQHEYVMRGTDDRFIHYLWVLRPNGDLDTVMGERESYLEVDFSLARDRWGNEYYTRQFLRRRDTINIYKRTPDGRETVFARGNFKGVSWLHPQDDGSLLFVRHNNVYRADSAGNLRVLAQGIGNPTASFTFAGNNPIVYGLWQDSADNVYAAVFSDQTVRRIAPDGKVSDVYRSSGAWTPIQGIFDNEGRLWVLEASDKNETRLTLAGDTNKAITPKNKSFLSPLMVVSIGLFILFLGLLVWQLRRGRNQPSAPQV